MTESFSLFAAPAESHVTAQSLLHKCLPFPCIGSLSTMLQVCQGEGMAEEGLRGLGAQKSLAGAAGVGVQQGEGGNAG